jgi:hypothetical protein
MKKIVAVFLVVNMLLFLLDIIVFITSNSFLLYLGEGPYFSPYKSGLNYIQDATLKDQNAVILAVAFLCISCILLSSFLYIKRKYQSSILFIIIPTIILVFYNAFIILFAIKTMIYQLPCQSCNI